MTAAVHELFTTGLYDHIWQACDHNEMQETSTCDSVKYGTKVASPWRRGR
jgi:hypothetical protein